MDLNKARTLLSVASDEEPAVLPRSILSKVTVNDLEDDAAFQIGTFKDGVIHLDWEGRLRRAGDVFVADAEYLNTRKYWYSPLGLEQFMDLVRRAIETRQRTRADVELLDFEDDGAYIHLTFAILTNQTNAAQAFEIAESVSRQIEEVAQSAADEIGRRVAEVAARLSGWGSATFDGLVDRVQTAKTSDERGRSLEELCSRLFAGVAGFSVSGRLLTATEEIDISIVNDSQEPRLRREGALVIVECKNWSGKCGKNEFVIFREKLENRKRRCSLGFLVSWNGFTGTVTKELLRGSHEETLVVPITGADLRAAVRDHNFHYVLLSAWDKAVAL